MIYFDNAATGGRKPDEVISAVSSAVKVCANAGRSGHKLALSVAREVEKCRKQLSEFMNGYDFERTVFTKNCTEALNIAIFGTLKRGDHVVVSPMEHNSVLRPLERLKKQNVIDFDVCALDDTNNVSPENILPYLRKNTRLVAVTLASNVTGATPPIAKIRKALPKEILLLCDGAQAGGHTAIHMQKWGIDLLALAGHKGLCGIQGSGALLFSRRVELLPLLYGGTGSVSLSLDMPDFYPDALEAGTLAFPAIASLGAGVRYLSAHLEETSAKTLAFTQAFITALRGLPSYEVFSAPNRSGIVAFRHKTLQSESVADILSTRYDIAVRGGLHCAPLMHEALGSLDGGLVRVSFSQYNSEREVQTLLSALAEIKAR